MTTTPAMPELSRGQIIDLISPQSKNSADHDIEFAYRVRAALSSQPSPELGEVSDAEILALAALNPGPWLDVTLIAFARAILALRPQAVPMTDEQRQRVFAAAEYRIFVFDNVSWRDAIVDEVEVHHGITAQGAQGEQG